MPSIPQTAHRTPSRDRLRLAARVLGVLAVVAAALSMAWWHRASPAAVVLSSAATRAGVEAGRTDELRISPASSDEKAHLARREPLPLPQARARAHDRPDLRLDPLERAPLLAVWPSSTPPLAGALDRGDRRRAMPLCEAAPESAAHRAAHPVRGPPADHVA